jgi:hypothetical protein
MACPVALVGQGQAEMVKGAALGGSVASLPGRLHRPSIDSFRVLPKRMRLTVDGALSVPHQVTAAGL